jgi:NAD(P)-dependent dehydrogenase (short-subunit alcohol dehydrogenase family)
MTTSSTAFLPDMAGRSVIVTGANSGIGRAAASALAGAGAHVVLAVRDTEKGRTAAAGMPGETEVRQLDLASLASVREFAAAWDGELALLINNAGVMAPPLGRTVDGFELQFGTNVLGHFALTALLLPALERTAALPQAQAPRVVMVASIAHKRGRLDFDDLQSTRSYSPMKSYQQSKLADLMLALEMDRRLKAAGSRIVCNAAHPGVANTNLFQPAGRPALERAVRRIVGNLIGALLNSDEEGALPTLYAAVAPEARGGGYYGPQGFQEMRGGDVGDAKIAPQALDQAAAARLWSVCEALTGVRMLDRA